MNLLISRCMEYGHEGRVAMGMALIRGNNILYIRIGEPRKKGAKSPNTSEGRYERPPYR